LHLPDQYVRKGALPLQEGQDVSEYIWHGRGRGWRHVYEIVAAVPQGVEVGCIADVTGVAKGSPNNKFRFWPGGSFTEWGGRLE
jgi:hypothetical protein